MDPVQIGRHVQRGILDGRQDQHSVGGSHAEGPKLDDRGAASDPSVGTAIVHMARSMLACDAAPASCLIPQRKPRRRWRRPVGALRWHGLAAASSCLLPRRNESA
jgi:hypothetical protein